MHIRALDNPKFGFTAGRKRNYSLLLFGPEVPELLHSRWSVPGVVIVGIRENLQPTLDELPE